MSRCLLWRLVFAASYNTLRRAFASSLAPWGRSAVDFDGGRRYQGRHFFGSFKLVQRGQKGS